MLTEPSHGASKLKGHEVARAQQCLDAGQSNRQVAQAVGGERGSSRGALPEAPAQSEAAQSVAKAGVLAALPALLGRLR